WRGTSYRTSYSTSPRPIEITTLYSSANSENGKQGPHLAGKAKPLPPARPCWESWCCGSCRDCSRWRRNRFESWSGVREGEQQGQRVLRDREENFRIDHVRGI